MQQKQKPFQAPGELHQPQQRGVAGVLAPNSFTCLGSPCAIPASGNRPGEIPFANVERPCSLKLNLPEPIIPHQASPASFAGKIFSIECRRSKAMAVESRNLGDGLGMV